ncbi:hypothetical protein HDA32_003815 [Spinactinospora alkalitolerans]|uniref:SAV-6107-like HEPN domain-containing protein n=1 Tax=Spinactinospora alkalitolerans TaxID=687207 RepID=A0A852TZD6_9ACTN|nr:SAV_6107 family HEPN domain-containing protein [Spinactinospora alkalitolerans]NYE48695.1 hypothetical protein [Spinactinospora alkalitolerans]
MAMSQPPIFSDADTAAAHPPRRPTPAALNMLESARQHLRDAAATTVPELRYVSAHMAGLRAAAAVLAQRGEPTQRPSRRRRPRSVWEMLPEAAPELREWAAFFAAGAAKRAAAEANLPSAVTAAEADDLLKDAQVFLSLAETTVGVPRHPTVLPRAS